MGIGISGLTSGMDTDSIVQALVSTKTYQKEKLEKAQTKLQWKQETWKDLNKKIYNFYSKTLSNMRLKGNYNKKTTSISDASVAKITAGGSSVDGTQTLGVEQLAKSGYLTGGQVKTTGGGKASTGTTLGELGITGNTSITLNGTSIAIGKDTKVSDLVSSLKSAGVNASFDSANQRFFVSAKESGTAGDFTLGGDTSALKSLGLYTGAGNPTDGTGAVRIQGQDAIIYLNGAKFTSSTNDFTVNGLSITAQELTGTDEAGNLKTVSITTSTDTQAIYDMVKDFFKGYNELMTEMSTLYNAETAKGYEPLTDDEKESMSEKDIEKWEEKIKNSLLRRDSSLSNIMNVMTSSLSGGVTIDGQKHYLSELGIKTGGYLYSATNERNNYHIDGDTDDDLTGSETDKLMAAIIKDPDSVTELMTGLANTMYDKMTQAMRSTSLSSTYTAYNDKQMQEEYNNYTKKISEMETKIQWWEDYYYRQFTTMETMLAKLNSQTSSLSGMLG